MAIVTNISCTYPPTHGAARRIWGLAGALDQLGLAIQVLDTSPDKVLHYQQVARIRVLSFPPILPGRTRRRRSSSPLRTASPIRRILDLRPRFNPRRTAYLSKLRFQSMLDTIQIEFPYSILDVLPIRNLGARVVLDEHGVEADFLHEILASIGKSPTPIESAEVRFQEGVAIHAASSVFCCSEHDKARLSRLYGGRPSKYYVVQNGVDEEFFRPVEPYRFSERTVLYLGSFGHLPNLYAIDWIAKHVIPRVQHAIPEARFVFVGSGETPRVREGVFIRDVEDVRPYIHGAQVGLATVFHGSGSRLKILEYSACGLPVVASTKGIEGLSLKAGSEVLIADDPESVARAIIELLTNKALSTQLARNAMLRVRSEYTWIAIASKALPAYLK